MAQVKHKQQYRVVNESNKPRSVSRSKAQITIVDIREEVTNDSLLRLQKIGELLINARILQAKSGNVQSGTNEDENCLNPKTYSKVQ